jgi:cell division protein FtsB
MTNSDRNTQAKFRRDAINVMSNHAEVVNMRLDKTEATVARATDAVEQQTQNMTALTANVQRLERAVSELAGNIGLMVAENRSQRETVNNLIRLATTLVEKAS